MEEENRAVTSILGAGLCGLTIATKLQNLGKSVSILEKSKSVGGRMATRRDGQSTYDHGAQFYKTSDRAPFLWDTKWSQSEIAQVWFRESDQVFMSGAKGMTTLAKDLATQIRIHFEEKILKLESFDNGIRLFSESGKTFEADQVILTCPLPQSLEILKNSQMEYPAALDEILYAKALVGLFEVASEDPQVRSSTFKKFNDFDIFSIANNQSKKVSENLAFTVVMAAEFSEKFFDSADPEVPLAEIEKAFLKVMPIGTEIKKSQMKKWRFSHPHSKYSTDMLIMPNSPRVILAGDAFGGGSLSGATRSAEAVLQYLAHRISV